MAILHIYGALALSLLFCDNQDSESESQETEIGVYGKISSQEKITKTLWDNDIHTLQNGGKMGVINHIYGDRALSLPFKYHQDTESE